MPDSLEEKLRGLAKKGELNYISITPKWDGKKHTGFSATYCPSSGFGYGFGIDTDPVVAILSAIRNWKPETKPKKEKKIKAPEDDLPDPCA